MTNEELIEIKDHINYLDKRFGLKPETIDDIRKAISLQKKDNDTFKNLDMQTLDIITKKGWGAIKD